MPRIAYKILRKAKERKLPFSRSASVLYPAGWCTSSVEVASSQCPYGCHWHDPSAVGGMLDREHGREDHVPAEMEFTNIKCSFLSIYFFPTILL